MHSLHAYLLRFQSRNAQPQSPLPKSRLMQSRQSFSLQHPAKPCWNRPSPADIMMAHAQDRIDVPAHILRRS